MKKNLLYSIFMFNIAFFSLLTIKCGLLPFKALKYHQLMQSINSLPMTTDATLEQSPYFDTKNLLNNRQKTIEQLKKDGFRSVSFNTPDGITLNGFFLYKSHSIGTVICVEGYHRGTRFDAAALTPLIPDNYNILYVNQRGYHPSKGKSWKNLWFFGLHQYQDIIGAIQFISTLNGKPIILWGTCAGAFNATHALLHLQEQQLEYSVKGLVFDSGWTCVSDTVNNFNKNMIRQIMRVPTVSKPDSIIEKIGFGLLSLLKKILLLDYCFAQYNEQTTLLGKMQTISIPVLFIHCTNDAIASYEQVQPLIAQTPHAFSWIVPESTHAIIHIKQKNQYQQVLTKFLDYVQEV